MGGESGWKKKTVEKKDWKRKKNNYGGGVGVLIFLNKENDKKEQNEIIDKIINTLELDNNNSIILYNLDNDINKQNKILCLTHLHVINKQYRNFKI